MEVRIKMAAVLVCAETSFLGLQTAAFSLGLRMTFPLCVTGGGERVLVTLFLQGHQSYWIVASPLFPCITFITFLKVES